jgi:hypothetical protein
VEEPEPPKPEPPKPPLDPPELPKPLPELPKPLPELPKPPLEPPKPEPVPVLDPPRGELLLLVPVVLLPLTPEADVPPPIRLLACDSSWSTTGS